MGAGHGETEKFFGPSTEEADIKVSIKEFSQHADEKLEIVDHGRTNGLLQMDEPRRCRRKTTGLVVERSEATLKIDV